MSNKMSLLPVEIINKILNYTDVIVFRNGKYIDRLKKTDKRYKLLKDIIKPIYFGLNRFALWLPINPNFDIYNMLVLEYMFEFITQKHILTKHLLIKSNQGLKPYNFEVYIKDNKGNFIKLA